MDCLIAGRVSEAKARLALMLAQLVQVACNRGLWLIASEVSLEATGPPFSAFARRTAPEQNEVPFSKLLDPRWVEAFVARVKEQEEYVERRDRLGKRKPPSGDQSAADGEAARAAAAKAKGRQDAATGESTQ